MKNPDHFHDLDDEDHEIFIHTAKQNPPKGFDESIFISWLKEVLDHEDKNWHRIEYVFCSDQDLLALNKTYLQHNTLTDIITFPYQHDPLVAEIYISLDRVNENAFLYSNGSTLLELARVMVHGILHLCGYDDHNDIKKQGMRKRESYYLQALQKFEF